MNLRRSTVVLRVRSAPEILDIALLFCARHVRLFTWLWLCTMLPVLLACLVLRHVLGGSWLQVWIVAVTAGLALQGVFTVTASRLLFEENVRVRDVLAQFWRAAPRQVSGLALHLGFLAAGTTLLVTAPTTLMRVVFTREIMLLERSGAAQAISRGGRLAKHQGWPIVGMWAALGFGLLCAVALGELLGDAVVHELLQLGRPFGSLWTDGGSPWALAAYLVALPYVATARFLKYIDIRTRKEGWDIQLKLMVFTQPDPRPRSNP